MSGANPSGSTGGSTPTTTPCSSSPTRCCSNGYGKKKPGTGSPSPGQGTANIRPKGDMGKDRMPVDPPSPAAAGLSGNVHSGTRHLATAPIRERRLLHL